MADTLVAKDPSTGKSMLDLGYSWVVLDDCWHPSRDANGTLVPFPRFFPHGMQPVIEYVHSLGLTFGLYTSVGDVTCHGGWSPGSLGHWQQDADTFAAWGVDCTPLLPLRPPLLAARGSDGLRFVLSDVKIDYCGNGTDPSGHHAMSQVIRLLHTHETVARGSEHRFAGRANSGCSERMAGHERHRPADGPCAVPRPVPARGELGLRTGCGAGLARGRVSMTACRRPFSLGLGLHTE